MSHKKIKIYKTRWHLIATLIIVAIPFIFLLLFSQFADIDAVILFKDIGVSFFRLFIAYIIAVVLAWICAVLFHKGKRAAIALPIFDVLQSFPTFAALPIAVYFWGATNFTVIFFLVITIVWPIFFSVISSLRLAKRDWEEAAEIYHLRGLIYIKKFLLPISVPGLITGTIVGLGEGWEALVATEIIIKIKSGLGNFFQNVSSNTTITIFGILGLLLLIFSINKLIWLPLLNRSHKLMEE
jgi:ABC-type nitrate/sulfonate/bicarbonate transport system permease component